MRGFRLPLPCRVASTPSRAFPSSRVTVHAADPSPLYQSGLGHASRANTLSNLAAIRQRLFVKNCRMYFSLSRNPNQIAGKNIFEKIGCVAPNRIDKSPGLVDTVCMTLTDSDANNEVTR